MEQEQVYKSMETRFFQAGLDLAFSVLLSGSTDSRWVFQVHDHTPNQEYKVAYEGNLQQTIELILLGKLHKAQLQAIDSKEPVQLYLERCYLCGEPVLSINPHYDCAQKEAFQADRS